MKYTIYDNWNKEVLHTFNKKKECENWIIDGLMSCEGAERDHYVSMLGQLKSGEKTLCYWEGWSR